MPTRIGIFLDDFSCEKFQGLCEKSGLKQSQMVAVMIDFFYQNSIDANDVDTQKILNTVYEDIGNPLLYITRDTNKMVFHILNFLNSYMQSLSETETINDEEYLSAKNNPHPWLEKSQYDLDIKIKNHQFKNKNFPSRNYYSESISKAIEKVKKDS